jgi:hypothetical protein
MTSQSDAQIASQTGVVRHHAVHANAWCDGGCRWQEEDSGPDGVARVRAAARRHAATERHSVALDVTSLDRYDPAP